ncbi:MAG: calcium-binding protein [Methyloversatilis sp.]|nr:calcium-binding protein [Methyloversatilis sp.]MDP3872592.1 calcium-binding protein [Methyloversatilis sp.]
MKYGTNDQITVREFFGPGSQDGPGAVEQFMFSDNVVWNAADIRSRVTITGTNGNDYLNGAFDDTNRMFGLNGNDSLTGGALADQMDGGNGDDTLTGMEGDDTLVGGAGNDLLQGRNGNDTYRFTLGDGVDVIEDNDFTPGNADVLTFANVASTALRAVERNSQDLVIKYGANDQITVREFFGPGSQDGPGTVEQFMFSDNVVWSAADIRSRVTITGTNGNDNLNGAFDDTNRMFGLEGDDSLTGGMSADQMDGGTGNDLLRGLGGNDTYKFSLGAGVDVIDDGDFTPGNVDVVTFADVASTALRAVERNTIDLVIKYGTNDQITVREFFGPGSQDGPGAVEQFMFSDNVVWTAADIRSRVTITGTNGNDYLNGAFDDTNRMFGLDGHDSLTGGMLADQMGGGNGDDTLTGMEGDDTLDGGMGNDTMAGNAGNDTFIVDSVLDNVIEIANEGTDTVNSSVSWTLPSHVENLTLTGSASINATGNSLSNVLTGNNSANVLNGGAGADTMAGGSGNDTYVVDSAADVVTEFSNAGTDTVQSGVTYTLGANLENLTLTGSAAINATGNALNNVLTGNSAANVLNGGAGADTMAGGSGDDIYVVDSASDVVTENSNAGTDTVQSSVTYTLGANLENLTLTGSATINATGNSLNNVLTGNSAANVLNGGAGADTMAGGGGDDTYVVDSSSDVVIENASAGIDTVQSSVTFTLGSDVEKLVLTGTAATEGRGNALENVLSGNSAANTLYGDAAGTSGNTAPLTSLSVFARGSIALGAAPIMEVWIDGVKAQTFEVSSTTTQEYVISAANLPATAAHRVDVVFTNDAYDGATGQDRNLYVERLRFNGRDYLTNTDQLLLDYGNGAAARDGMNITLATSGVIATNAALRFSLDGSDRLDGGAGADTLIGGNGDDMYYVDNASDSVVELSGQGLDTVKSSVSHTLAGNVENLVLTGSAIAGTGNDLANLIIGNASNNILDGGGSTDSLRGGAGADTLIGGLGNDLLDGGAGNDIYRFSRGDGQDSIWESDTTAGNQDVMSFDSTVAYDQLWLKRVGNNLEVSVIGTTDKITVSNWYVSNQWHVEQVAASDKILVDTQVQALVDAMAAMTPPPLGQTALSAAQVSALQPVLASSWQ